MLVWPGQRGKVRASAGTGEGWEPGYPARGDMRR